MNMDQFEDMMNDSYPPYIIGTYEFLAGSILRKMDYEAFKEAYYSFINTMEEEEV